jgi:hypothetical protein
VPDRLVLGDSGTCVRELHIDVKSVGAGGKVLPAVE